MDPGYIVRTASNSGESDEYWEDPLNLALYSEDPVGTLRHLYTCMDNVEESKLRITQKCIPALTAKDQSAALALFVDTSHKDEVVKADIETKLAIVKQNTDDLLNCVKEINAESDILRRLVESHTDQQQRETATNDYKQFMHSDKGPVHCLLEVNNEVKRLENEQVRLQRLLDYTNTRISVRTSEPLEGGAQSLSAMAVLPSLSQLLQEAEDRARADSSANRGTGNGRPVSATAPSTCGGSPTVPYAVTTNTMHAMLPRIQLPKFSGSWAEFPSFFDTFTALVDNVSTIPDVQKLTILLSCLDGPARQAVAGYPVTNARYAIIKDVLVSQYGNPRLMLRDLHAQLQNIRHAQESLTSARSTVAEVERVLRILESHNQDIDHELMLATVESKLPKFLLKEISDIRLLLRDQWSLKMLRKVVADKLTNLEELASIDRSRGYAPRAETHTSGNQASNPRNQGHKKDRKRGGEK